MNVVRCLNFISFIKDKTEHDNAEAKQQLRKKARR